MLGGGIALCAISSRAHAQQVSPPPTPDSQTSLPAPAPPSTPLPPSSAALDATPPAPPARKPARGCDGPSGSYCHDGFYARLTVGFFYSEFLGRGPQGNALVSSAGTDLNLTLGGTVARGLVIGGTIRGALSGLWEIRGTFVGGPPGDTAAGSLLLLGPMLDWYPVAEEGWHVGGAAGLGGLGLLDYQARIIALGNAFAVSLWGGYDWWVAPQWSIGLLTSLSTATTSEVDYRLNVPSGYTFTPLIVTAEVSLLWH